MKLLRGTRVLELAGPYGESCARFLGSLGADVVRVVAPALDASFLRPSEDLWDQYTAHGKATLTLDLDAPDDIVRFRDLVAQSDFLIESAPYGALRRRGLDYESLRGDTPGIIHASISPFGSDGPYAPYRGSELVTSAMSGILRQRGDRDRPPVKEALDACVFHACAVAAAAILLAHHERCRSRRGQHVDISLQQVGVSRNVGQLLRWQFERRRPARAGTSVWERRVSVRCIWTLADGYLFHRPSGGTFGAGEQAWAAFMDEVGFESLLRETRWTVTDRGAVLADKRARWEQTLARFLETQGKADIAREVAARGIDAMVVADVATLLSDPQLAARGFWTRRELANGSVVQMPAHFVRVTPAVVDGEPSTAARSVPERARALRSVPETISWDVKRGVPRSSALSGVKVLELSSQLVGSLTGRALAEHGAQVIKLDAIEGVATAGIDPRRAASLRHSIDATAWFVHLQAGKLSVCVDRAHARTRELVAPLLAWADVVIESFAPDAPERRALGYPKLAGLRADLVVVSASPYGGDGPRAEVWDGDEARAARVGRVHLSGWPDRPPVAPGTLPYDDFVTSSFLVGAIAAALSQRRRTGEGCHIDAAMFELGAQQLSEALLDAQCGQPLGRTGNRGAHPLIQGVYPTRGDDRWIAITIADARDWGRLVELMGKGFPDAEVLRRADDAMRDAVDEAIAAFTSSWIDVELMHMLQARGIAAGVLQDADDLIERDPQLRARGAFVTLEHPVLGAFAHQALPYRLDGAPAVMRTSPLLGQHTDYVCRRMLGLGDAQIAAWTQAGLLI